MGRRRKSGGRYTAKMRSPGCARDINTLRRKSGSDNICEAEKGSSFAAGWYHKGGVPVELGCFAEKMGTIWSALPRASGLLLGLRWTRRETAHLGIQHPFCLRNRTPLSR